MQWVDGTKIVAAPKADSVRVVAFPPHLGDAIREHLKTHAQWGKDGLLFPTTHGEQYRAPTFHQAYFRKAREAAERPTCASMTFAIREPPWPRHQAPPSPS